MFGWLWCEDDRCDGDDFQEVDGRGIWRPRGRWQQLPCPLLHVFLLWAETTARWPPFLRTLAPRAHWVLLHAPRRRPASSGSCCSASSSSHWWVAHVARHECIIKDIANSKGMQVAPVHVRVVPCHATPLRGHWPTRGPRTGTPAGQRDQGSVGQAAGQPFLPQLPLRQAERDAGAGDVSAGAARVQLRWHATRACHGK